MAGRAAAEERDGIALSNLDTALFDGADATKRDLVDHLDALCGQVVAGLTGRALSVVRVLRGQDPFMQKNTPRYAPDWLPTLPAWAASSGRQVRYPVVDERRGLLWFANQRAVEYHPQLFTGTDWHRQTHLVVDLDPPQDADPLSGTGFRAATRTALLVREVLAAAGMAAAVKTSGSKGVHVVVPLDVPADGAPLLPSADGGGSWTEDVMAATRAVAARAERLDPALATTAYLKADRGGKVFLDATRSGGATVVAAYSPRVRPGTPVSWPVPWSDLDRVLPRDATVRTARGLLASPDADPWRDLLPAPQALDPSLVEEGRAIPVARVAAMHEGKRRARARREAMSSGPAGGPTSDSPDHP